MHPLRDRRWVIAAVRLGTLVRMLGLRGRLPPGSLTGSRKGLRTDQKYLLKKGRELGSVFKVLGFNAAVYACIIGHRTARDLLVRNEEHLQGVAVDVSSLFSGGFLRQMRGDTHHRYRRAFLEPFQAAQTPLWLEGRVLDRFDSAARAGGPLSRRELRDILRGIAADCMLAVLYGVEPGSERSAVLQAAYDSFGYDPPVRIGRPQQAAFVEIKAEISRMISEIQIGSDVASSQSVLKHLVHTRCLDETTIGNLIHMFVLGHCDLFCLWHWITKYIAENPAIIARIRSDAATGDIQYGVWAEAIVLETLRLNQSEALLRLVEKDIELDGYLIPRGSIVRACLWEGHKDPDVFADPHSFQPARFVRRKYPAHQFAPFGLDKHLCLAANLTIRLSTVLVEQLIKKFDLVVAADGDPILNPVTHWEPSPKLRIGVNRRTRTDSRHFAAPFSSTAS